MTRSTRLFAAGFWLSILLSAGLAQADARTDAAACLGNSIPSNQLRCLSKAAMAANDAGLCLLSQQPGVRWLCVAQVAVQGRDPSLCDRALGMEGEPKGVARDFCVTHLALTWNAAELCANLTTANLGDACYYQLVEAGANPRLCERVKNQGLKSICGKPD